MNLEVLVGQWEISLDLPGEESLRGTLAVTRLGPLLELRSGIPGSAVPDSVSMLDSGDGVQHYFDERGVVRLYATTLDDRTWTALRDTADFSPLTFQQRWLADVSEDGSRITGEWQTSDDGQSWQRDFGIVYNRR